MLAETNKSKIKIMQVTLLFSILIMIIKFSAYYYTHSVAILSDALESIINIVAGGFALFSVYYAAKPKDEDHPYGHGKIENLSAGFEGGLIFIAGISILLQSIDNFLHPVAITELNIGLVLSVLAGSCNFFMGYFLTVRGKKYNSLTMEADGKHLISDAVSSAGLVIGLVLIMIFKYQWLDGVIASIFGVYIIWTGFKLIREAVYNLLDKTDIARLEELSVILQENRRPKWIDMHNLRILKYGHHLHIDAHITLPWYDSLEDSHNEMKEVERIVKEKLGDTVEFFLHPDPCLPNSCTICNLVNCKERKKDFVHTINWNLENLIPNQKHSSS